jgi:imidazole glycerol-phosphate synthase subunit HisH
MAADLRIVLLDSGGANLGSVQAAFARLGHEAPVSSDWARIKAATHVVLPGVGAAAPAMATLRANGLDTLVGRLSQPLIGICIGMQLLYERSGEGGTECLGLLPGSVSRLPASEGIRVPHMGWNRLDVRDPSHPLVAGLDREWVYFVHSYAASPSAGTLANCMHGQPFAAVVAEGRVMGAQFHPERSASAGARLLRNFLDIAA